MKKYVCKGDFRGIDKSKKVIYYFYNNKENCLSE